MPGSTGEQQRDGGFSVNLTRPCALAGTRFDPIVALGCVAMLTAIFIVEVMTPDDVVGAVAILPLAAGAWMLSSRRAHFVITASALLFIASVVVEAHNRVTLLLVGIPLLVTAGVVTLYAARLSREAPGAMLGRPSFVAWPGSVADDSGGRARGSLTNRELEVARLAARAYTAAEIGHQLHIGERTVESHIASTYLKLGVRSRSELIRMASRLG
jgi:DNA-binding CsgD family transcriptional regulator